MSRALRAWKAVLVVKDRAVDRANDALAQCRAGLAAREQAARQATAHFDAQRARAAAAGQELARLLASGGAMLPEAYLMHKAYLRHLDEEVGAARKACEAAERHRTHALDKTRTAQRVLARAQTSRDTCRERCQALLDRIEREAEAARDDEASETAAARRYRAARAASSVAAETGRGQRARA